METYLGLGELVTSGGEELVELVTVNNTSSSGVENLEGASDGVLRVGLQ
jgi:hypothetical protein